MILKGFQSFCNSDTSSNFYGPQECDVLLIGYHRWEVINVESLIDDLSYNPSFVAMSLRLRVSSRIKYSWSSGLRRIRPNE